jgi:hypothetical protein
VGCLRFYDKVARLAGGNGLARLQLLQGGEGNGDLGAWLAWPQARLVDHNLLDGGGVALLWRLKEKNEGMQ